MTTEKTVTTATDSPGVTRPGLALAVIAGAQFMVVLDGTIMNIALSSIQQAFDMSGVLLAWVVNAYALAFGGFLLLGGRLGDVLGRVAIFRVGLVLFAGASLLGGLAWSQEVLIGARVLQGMGAAIVAPAALALIATSFEGQARGRAMGLYGAMAGLGSTAGLLFGGVLTSYASWRWVLLVNIPIAVALFLGARYLRSGERHRSELNIPSAVLGTLGVTSLVYAITRSGEHGWGDPASIALYGAAAVFIGVFVVAQDRVAHPLLPLAILRDRTRAGANVAMLLLGTGMFATYYFFTLYMQQVLGYSAIESALAYLPWATAIFVGSGVLAPRLLPRLAPAVIAGGGLSVTALGMLWLSFLDVDSGYATAIVAPMVVTALGLGSTFVPLTISAMSRVDGPDSGAAAAVMNTAQQVGGAIGLATLVVLATQVSTGQLPSAAQELLRAESTGDETLLASARAALSEGFTTAFLAVAGIYVLAAVVVALTVRRDSAVEGQQGSQREGRRESRTTPAGPV
ncbi:MFS transporter [Aeromicrobium erythreum]|uniref:MFS transporter n=1 Tax=Aeromicrobium erythreum TaxID=2041 RepID=A0A0U4ATA7_9ACTN|nr:MFS transporter [Aeromicrobium erythreum]ALX03680.1 MFS transporter [Aeromicrobium erythreum]